MWENTRKEKRHGNKEEGKMVISEEGRGGNKRRGKEGRKRGNANIIVCVRSLRVVFFLLLQPAINTDRQTDRQ